MEKSGRARALQFFFALDWNLWYARSIRLCKWGQEL